MISLQSEIDLLEKCAEECRLIGQLSPSRDVRDHNQQLANEYQALVDRLKESANSLPEAA